MHSWTCRSRSMAGRRKEGAFSGVCGWRWRAQEVYCSTEVSGSPTISWSTGSSSRRVWARPTGHSVHTMQSSRHPGNPLLEREREMYMNIMNRVFNFLNLEWELRSLALFSMHLHLNNRILDRILMRPLICAAPKWWETLMWESQILELRRDLFLKIGF